MFIPGFTLDSYFDLSVLYGRPDATTPSALIWHARLACVSKEVMQRTQRNSTGMTVRKESWDQ